MQQKTCHIVDKNVRQLQFHYSANYIDYYPHLCCFAYYTISNRLLNNQEIYPM